MKTINRSPHAPRTPPTAGPPPGRPPDVRLLHIRPARPLGEWWRRAPTPPLSIDAAELDVEGGALLLRRRALRASLLLQRLLRRRLPHLLRLGRAFHAVSLAGEHAKKKAARRRPFRYGRRDSNPHGLKSAGVLDRCVSPVPPRPYNVQAAGRVGG